MYRARDGKLKREVAVKVLPPSLAADPDRLARFQREAEVLASLNHRNIAAISGLEEADGVKALIMELVEGPTLAERIAGASGGPAGPPLRTDARLSPSTKHSRSRSRSPKRSKRRTRRGSSTAASSPPTSSCGRMAW